MPLRWANRDDYEELGRIMFDAVRNGPSRYDAEQRAAWVPEPRSGDDWNARLAEQAVIIADTDGAATGFMSLAPGGYVDFAYIRPAYQGTGLFRRLFEAIRKRAEEDGAKRLRTHASLMAEPAFSAMGFQIVRKEIVELRGQHFERFEMEYQLR